MHCWTPIFVTFLAAVTPSVSAQSVWELTPYQVNIVVSIEAASSAAELEFADRLTERIEATIGGAWEIDTAPVPEALRPIMPGLAALEQNGAGAASTQLEQKRADRIDEPTELGSPLANLMPKSWLGDELDKVLLVSITRATPGWQATARDFDVRARRLGAATTVRAEHPDKLDDATIRAIIGAFSPLAQIETVDGNHVGLRLRAASLPVRDPAYRAVVPGDLFVPVTRYDDREGRPRRITDVPWTVLQVESVDAAVIESRLFTGMRSPLSARRRGRVRQYALLVRPPGGSTQLTVSAPGNPPTPLAGYDLYDCPILPEEQAGPLSDADAESTEKPVNPNKMPDGGDNSSGDPKEASGNGPVVSDPQAATPPAAATPKPAVESAKLLSRTDRFGRVDIESKPGHPLRVLMIKNGTRPLARLPIIPGFSPALSVYVPDDDQRLDAEGRLRAIEEELIDLVTQRQILIARAQSLIQAGKHDEATLLLGRFRGLKTRDRMLLDLDQQHARTLTSNPATQQRIDAMYDKARELVIEYLPSGAIDKLMDDLN